MQIEVPVLSEVALVVEVFVYLDLVNAAFHGPVTKENSQMSFWADSCRSRTLATGQHFSNQE